MALTVNVINDNIRMILEAEDSTAMHLGSRFPMGEVYVRFVEPQGVQWRMLQRGTRDNSRISYFNQLLPISVDSLPECVQVVHLCTE
jgi:hypothetical protein